MLLLYSSSEGQTRKVAAHVIEYLTVGGKETWIEDVENPREPMNAADYRAVVIVASVPLGQEARTMISFVRDYRKELMRLPTALLAISLVAASAEDPPHQQLRHARSGAEVAKATDDFLWRASFTPSRILPIAGALLYTQQGRFVRFALQRIANAPSLELEGHPDFETIAWHRLDRFVDEFLTSNLRPSLPARKAALAHG